MINALADTLTPSEAAAIGAVAGMTYGVLIAGMLVWFVLQVIADWKIFTKAGQPGWKSIIPIYNYYVEYDICWSGAYGLFYAVAMYLSNYFTSGAHPANWQVTLAGVLVLVMLVLHFMESRKLAAAFGKGSGFAVCLFLFGPIARLILGFGSAEYVGKN